MGVCVSLFQFRLKEMRVWGSDVGRHRGDGREKAVKSLVGGVTMWGVKRRCCAFRLVFRWFYGLKIV